jgi:leucyl-tRNA synthetase
LRLAALYPSDDVLEVLSDHDGYVLDRRDLGPQDVRAPLLEHGGDNVDLLAFKDFVRMLTIKLCVG